MSMTPPQELKIYYLFAAEEADYSKRLASHLSTLKEQHHIIEFHHNNVLAGEDIEQQITQHLHEAKIILLLVSHNLLDKEIRIVNEAMKRNKQEQVPVIPILVRPTYIDNASFAKQQILPRDKRAIAIWENEEEAFVQIVEAIRQVIEKVVGEDISPLSSQQLQLHHILETTEIKTTQEEQRVVIYLQSIEERKFSESAEYDIRWKKYFEQENNEGLHQLKDPTQWNKVLLQDLIKKKEKISKTTSCTLLRVYGQSRLCCWMAFGYVFRETTRYKLEIQQKDSTWWYTGVPADKDFVLERKSGPEGEIIDGEGDTIAIGIGIKQKPEKATKQYLSTQSEKIAALLVLESTGFLQNAQEAVALAEQVKSYAKEYRDHWNAKKMLLFYAGPIAGACFIGYKLNAVCPSIQVMEYNRPEGVYIPTFLLK